MNKQVFVALLVMAIANVCICDECDENSDDSEVFGFFKKIGCGARSGVDKVGSVIIVGAKTTQEGAESLGSLIVDGVKNGATATKKGVESLGGAIADGAVITKDIVLDGAKATKEGVENLGGKIADGAVSAKDSVLKVGSDIKN